MSRTATIASRRSVTGSIRMAAQSIASKPVVEIKIDGEQESTFVPSFTTGDVIKGIVSFTPKQDTRFDAIYITFEGRTKTNVERFSASPAVAARIGAAHGFLRMRQPMRMEDYPQPRIAESGRTYTFPFTFVVPGQMLESLCNHKHDHPDVQAAHLQLPPSMGDSNISGNGATLLDDMAPDMSKVVYLIRANVTRCAEVTGKEISLVDKTKRLRIIPAFDEQPPIDINEKSDDYILHVEKSLKKSAMSTKKTGRLTIEAAQPRSVRLPPVGSTDNAPAPSAATIRLRFDPTDDKQEPPRLRKLLTELSVESYFSAKPMNKFPEKQLSIYEPYQGSYTDTVALGERCVEAVQWELHTGASAPVRRDSAFSMFSESESTRIPIPSKGANNKHFYTASIIVPIALPKNKTFLPTFHSCLISRTYTLELKLGYYGAGKSLASHASLRIPLQISVARRPNTVPRLSAADIAAEQAQLEEFFNPRSVAPPSPEYVGRSSLAGLIPMAQLPEAPPGYTAFPSAAATVA